VAPAEKVERMNHEGKLLAGPGAPGHAASVARRTGVMERATTGKPQSSGSLSGSPSGER